MAALVRKLRSGTDRTAYLELLVVALLWGGGYPIGKLAVGEASPLIVAALRYLLATAILLPLLAVAREGSTIGGWRAMPIWVAAGITGVALYSALTYYALDLAPAADGAMIMPTITPVLTAILALPLLSERLSARHVLALALAASGQVLIFQGAILQGGFDLNRLLGDLMFLGAALSWALYSILNRVAARTHSALAATTYAFVLGTLFLLVAATPDLVNDSPSFSFSLIFYVGFLGLLVTAFPFLLYYRGVRRLGAGRTSMITLYLLPVFSLLASFILLGEQPGAIQLVGMGIVLVAVWLANQSVFRLGAREGAEAETVSLRAGD